MPELKEPKIVNLKDIEQPPYPNVICYPRPTAAETQRRLVELQNLGVEALEFTGTSTIANTPVLGKGYVGIVVVAYVRGERFALKMRRIDADRIDLRHEAEMLKKANTAGVGPKFVAVSNNFMLSQLIDGDVLAVWLEKHKEKAAMHKVLVEILEQCWRLDEAGLDHGELSKAPRHLLMNGTDVPFIVDFETASTQRHASNVTAVCQYLFAGNSVVPKLLAEVFGEKDRLVLITALRDYKKNRSRERFEALLKVCL
jgi:putative serine/threonine protein kinase